jgi:uroporphyrinogen-III synthase
MRLLVTRPEPDGERTAQKLRAQGYDVMLAPMLSVEMFDRADFGAGPWGAVVMTSANAARALQRHSRRGEAMAAPVFAVGRRTAEAARAVGCREVLSADGDVQDLVRLIASQGLAGVPILYLAGEERSGDLAGELATLGLQVRTVMVYRAVPVMTFPPIVQETLTAGAIEGALHFSRRSAEIYVNCAKAAGILDSALAPFHYCLSPQVAKPLAGAGKIRIARQPDEAALINLVMST